MGLFQVCNELYEPALGLSEEEEEEGFCRAKKAVQLIRVLAGIMPANFSSREVFERLTSLLKHEDREIGEWGDLWSNDCVDVVVVVYSEVGAADPDSNWPIH